MAEKKSPIWAALSILIIGGAIFYGGFQIGKGQLASLIRNQVEVEEETEIEEEVASSTDEFGPESELLWDALEVAREKYLRINDISEEDFLYGAIQGVIDALDDPNSSFFPPEDAQKFTEDLQGNFGGIGAEIGMSDEGVIVVAPLEGNPAERAGLQAGDRILEVDGESTAGKTVEEAVIMIRGKIGVPVTLRIFREGWSEARDIKITRANIQIPTLKWEMLQAPGEESANVAYIQLFSFNANAAGAFSDAVFQSLFQGTKGVILDLRNNTGGFLDAAVRIAGHFVERGEVITYQKFRSGEKSPLISRGNAEYRNLPVVVLVNGGSASASEIVAGALRDHRGAILVGQITFGKGSVQELQDLGDGSTLKITTAEWITPNGHSIDKQGLDPDVEVELPEPEEGAEEIEDTQRAKALELIAPLLGEKAPSPLTIEIIDLRNTTATNENLKP